MGELLASVIPLALGAAVSPLVFGGAIAVMTGPSPLRRGLAFAVGVSLPLLVATALALLLGSAISLPDASAQEKAWVDVGFGVILIALGLFTLSRPAKPAAKPAAAGPSARRLVEMGAGLMASNVTTFALYLPAMKLIGQSSVDDSAKAVAVVVVLLVTMMLVLIPLALVAVFPRTSEQLLHRAGDWLGAHRRAIGLALCFGFGAYLLIKGIAGF